ncbi:hypothetical protein FQA39_LY06940 [Lamprigera yunnana]|nr:hypothetical protein FQA39_LY06940 [Lamprigera yunnana]
MRHAHGSVVAEAQYLVMEWTNAKVCELIELCRLKEYKDRNKKQDALQEIADTFGVDKQVVEKKIKNVVCHFLREIKREIDSSKSGAGNSDVYKSKWFCFNNMLFLMDRNTPKETTDTITQKWLVLNEVGYPIKRKRNVVLRFYDSDDEDERCKKTILQRPPQIKVSTQEAAARSAVQSISLPKNCSSSISSPSTSSFIINEYDSDDILSKGMSDENSCNLEFNNNVIDCDRSKISTPSNDEASSSEIHNMTEYDSDIDITCGVPSPSPLYDSTSSDENNVESDSHENL